MSTGSNRDKPASPRGGRRRQQKAPPRTSVADPSGSPSTTSDLHLLSHPIVFDRPLRLVEPTSWVAHIPFAFWLMAATRPRTFVELGTQSGNSYSAFAQACLALGLDTACYAVDTWKGDHQAGFYSEDVFKEWSAFHDRHFSALSRLMRSTFDEASSRFPDASIDLLHIDGLHTYEAVRHDFDTWLPKLSDSAVVVLHDTNVRKADFGVWRLWKELEQEYPCFAFLHGHGLGVVGVGPFLPCEVRRLLERVLHDGQDASLVRRFFSTLGEALVREHDAAMRETALEERLAGQEALQASSRAEHAKALQQVRSESMAAIERSRAEHKAEIEQARAERDAAIERERVERATVASEIERLRSERGEKAHQLGELRQQLAGKNAELERRTDLLIQAYTKGKLGRWLRTAGTLLSWILRRPPGRSLPQVKEYLALRRSEHFDATYYVRHNLDVLVSRKNPLLHYLRNGARERRNPHPRFDTRSYLEAHPELKESDRNPYLHYLANRSEEDSNEGTSKRKAPHITSDPQGRTEATEELPGLDPRSEQAAALQVTHEHVARARAVVENAEVGRFSIVMPTWNRRQVLGRAIGSVLAQSYQDWELIVCDDGSTDGTQEYVQERFAPDIAARRIRYLRLTHRGVSAARNAGLREARGRWIAYLDSDNAWHRDYLLMTAAGYAAARRHRLAYACLHVHDAAHQYDFVRFQPFDWRRLLKQNFIDLNIFSHHRVLYEQLGGFDESLTRLVDWELILRYTQLYEPLFNPFVLCDYYISHELDNITLREAVDPNRAAIRREFSTSGSRGDTDRRDRSSEQISLKDPSLHKFSALNGQLIDWEAQRQGLQHRKPDLVSIVIPNYDLPETTQTCVTTILATGGADLEVIVVDNGSAPPHRRQLRSGLEHYENVRLLENDENYGFALGCNLGAAVARGEFVIWLNNDTEVTDGWIEPLIQPLRDDASVGIVGPKLIWPDGTLQQGGMVFPPRSKIPYHIYQGFPGDHPAVNKKRQFQVLSGACLAISAADFVELKGFDSIFRNGCEDLDLCLRMQTLLNKRVLYNPASVVIHHEGKTAGRSKYIQLNRETFVSKWGDQVEADDEGYYREDSFVVKRYVKRGAEPDGETALYHPELATTPEEVESGKTGDRRRTLRVGFVSIWHERGVSYVARQLALALEQDNRFETHILARWESARFRNAGSIFHPRVVDAGDDPTAQEAVEWARERRLDLIVFVEIHPNDWKRVEALKKAGFKVLCYEHLDVLRLDMLERYAQVDGFLASSFFAWRVWRKEFPGKPALALPWGVPQDLVRDNLERKPSPHLRFVHIAGWGGVHNRKNTDLCIEAFHEAAPPKARLSVFTQRPLGEYGEASIDVVRRDSTIDVHEGTLDNIWEIYQNADILLWPSKREGLGLPILEALASGLPVLISDGWLMKEWPVLGEHAVVCRERPGEAAQEAAPRYLPLLQVDREDLVRRIHELASSRTDVTAMTAAVRRDRSRWLWTWQADALGTELRRFLAEGTFHTDPASYIPADMLEFERRRAASRGDVDDGRGRRTEAEATVLPAQDTDVPRAEFLFIAGCQRSGTTALVHLLNQDDRIVIGRERFKHCRSSITPAHFREERFFFPDEKETNYRVEEFYDRLRARWRSDAVRYIGDKVPLYYKDLLYLAETFPGCKILFLVRDLEAVAASYNARAENPEDGVWKPDMDYRQAAEDWNESLSRLDEFVRAGHRDRVFVIQYERFFTGEESCLEALYEFLDLPVTADVREAFRTMTKDWKTRSSRPSSLTSDMVEHLSASRDRRLERRCLSLGADMESKTA